MSQILISHWGLQIRKIPAIVGVTFPDSSILSFQLRECFAEHKEGWEEGGSTREQPYGPRGWRILEYTGSQTYSSEEAMAPHSSTLAWKIPWTEEPGRLQSTESQRVGHDWVISLSLFTFMHWRRKWQPTPVFLPGESQGWQSLVGCCLWGRTESDTTKVT